MKSRIMQLVNLCLVLILVSGCMLFAGCKESPDKYTLEQHNERISERIQERYMSDGKYENYNIYPLFNLDDELAYFLVEFEPYGFMFVSLNTVSGLFNRHMYRRDDSFLSFTWQRYRICNDGREPAPYEGIQWQPKKNDSGKNNRYEVDGDGVFVEYNRSPYAVANVLNQKLYFLNVYAGYVPAIKQNNKFINLISMDDFICQGDREYYKGLGYDYVIDNIPVLSIAFHPEPSGSL